ncbi:MAG TPA: hypothetical protein VJO12_11595 [Stellaceae bacterium]|nr:hypothetical protein [Stellaceae bacterium]
MPDPAVPQDFKVVLPEVDALLPRLSYGAACEPVRLCGAAVAALFTCD